MLQVLWEHHLYAKFNKCDFYKPQIRYLGHIISKKGIVVDPKNIKSIGDFPTPTTITDIRSFLGLVGYYQNFIKNFSRMDCPMTTLENKANKFLWMTKCEESFQKLKHLLTISPILRITDPNGDFVVCIDASKEGLGGVLL